MCGTSKTEQDYTLENCKSIPKYDIFRSNLEKRLHAYDLKVGTNEEIQLRSPKHITNAIAKHINKPILVIFISTDILWNENELEYYRVLADLRDSLIQANIITF